MGTSQRLRELRHFLRTEISNSLMYVGNLDNQIVGGATNLDFSSLQESLNRIYNSMHQLFPEEVMEFKKKYDAFHASISTGNQTVIRKNLSNLRVTLLGIFNKIDQIPRHP